MYYKKILHAYTSFMMCPYANKSTVYNWYLFYWRPRWWCLLICDWSFPLQASAVFATGSLNETKRNNRWNTPVWSQGFKCHCHRYILYDAHNVIHMDAHDLMGLWEMFEWYPLCLSTSRQSDKIKYIRWLWSSKKAQQCQSSKKSAFILSQSALLSLYFSLVTHTQLCITRHPIAVMFCVATSFWCRFICEFVLSCVFVCIWRSLGMKAHPVKPCLTAVTLDGRPSFSLSKWLTHRWTRSAVNYPRQQERSRADRKQ